jgi:hypothetical protein
MKRFPRSRLILLTASAAVFVCAGFLAPAKTGARPDRDTAASQKATSAATVAPAPALHATDSTLFVPVPRWVNRKFTVLRKQKLFRQFGYELYLSKDLAGSKTPLDTSFETPKRHLRSDKVAGTTLVATAVEPAGDEFLVSFHAAGIGRTVFGKTHKGAIEGIASIADLDSAARRWDGAFVYSRRRFINTYDSITGNYGTVKVRVQDKLRVTGVSWGLTPLPTNPLWLAVEAPTKEKGFIPIAMSWTNTMADKIRQEPPWTEDLFEANPMDIYKWDSLTWNAINNHTIVSGMTKDQVIVSWGRPHTVSTDSSRHTCTEQWLYGSQYLCFAHDTVISVGAR